MIEFAMNFIGDFRNGFHSYTNQRGRAVHGAPLLPLGVVEDLPVPNRRVVALQRLGLEHRHVRPDYLDALGGGKQRQWCREFHSAHWEGAREEEAPVFWGV